MGSGSNADKLFENTKSAAAGMGLDDEVVLINDQNEAARYGVLKTPAVVVDGKVITEGKPQSVEELTRLIEKA